MPSLSSPPVFRGPRTPVCARLAALCLLVPAAVSGLTYQNASGGLPPTHRWDCNAVLFEQCNNPEDTGGWVGVDLADVDGDGNDDVVAVGRLLKGYHVWLSDGAGNWTEASTGLDPEECHGRSEIAFSDVDGDGFLDFGAIRSVNNSPGVFLGDGGASWSDSSTGLSGAGGEGLTFGDFDGDGNPDLANSAHFGGPMQAFLGDGSGSWMEVSRGLPGDVWAHRMAAGDFDGDGRDEIVDSVYSCTPALPGDPCSSIQSGVHIWRLGPNDVWSLYAEFFFDQPWEPATADLDQDGRVDLVVSARQLDVGTSGGVRAFLNNGDGTFTEASTGLPQLDAFYGGLDLGDLDNDDDFDVVVGTSDGDIRVFLNDGLSVWTEATGTGLPTGIDNVETIAVGDSNGDCLLDIGYGAYDCGVQVYEEQDPAACAILAEAGPPNGMCLGAPSLTLDAGDSRACGCGIGDIRYRWWADGALARDWDASATLPVSPAADTLYQVDVACIPNLACFVSDTVLIRVNPLPVPPITPAAPEVCLGDSVLLDGGGPWSSWLWSSDPPGEPGDGDTTPTVNVSPSDTTTYTLEVSDDLGCVGQNDAVVTVHPLPVPDIQPPLPSVCRGDLVTLSVPGTWDSVLWTTNPAGQPGDGATTPSIDVDPDQDTTYGVLVVDANGCEGQDQTFVAVHEPPTPVIDPPGADICEGETTTLTVQGVWSRIVWSTDPPGQPGDLATTPSIDVAPDTTTTYRVEVTDGNGCAGQDQAVVTVTAAPVPVIDPPAAEVCAGETTTLTVQGSWNSIVWSTNPAGQPGDGETTASIDVDPDTTTTYTVTVTDASDCPGQSQAVVTVNPAPTPEIQPASPQICSGDSVMLSVPGTWTSIQWTTEPPGEPGDGADTQSIDVSPSTVTTYMVTVVDENGCAAQDATVVDVLESPMPQITPDSADICEGESLRLSTDPGWTSVVWTTDPTGQPGDNATQDQIDVDPSVTTTYNLIVTDDDGCAGGNAALVTVIPDPVPPATGATFRVRKQPAGALLCLWSEIVEPVQAYEVVHLEEIAGPPDPGAMDAASIAATAPPGTSQTTDDDGQTTPGGLVFLKVRATSPCSGAPGPTAD